MNLWTAITTVVVTLLALPTVGGELQQPGSIAPANFLYESYNSYNAPPIVSPSDQFVEPESGNLGSEPAMIALAPCDLPAIELEVGCGDAIGVPTRTVNTHRKLDRVPGRHASGLSGRPLHEKRAK